MPIPYKLDYVTERLTADNGSERRTLRSLAGVSLTSDQARAAWPKVLEHKWYMSERMGRDVGLRVAAVDYFDNVARQAPPPRLRLFTDGGLPPRLPMMLPFGERY